MSSTLTFFWMSPWFFWIWKNNWNFVVQIRMFVNTRSKRRREGTMATVFISLYPHHILNVPCKWHIRDWISMHRFMLSVCHNRSIFGFIHDFAPYALTATTGPKSKSIHRQINTIAKMICIRTFRPFRQFQKVCEWLLFINETGWKIPVSENISN